MAVIVIMGVCGCGKTTVGESLAAELGCSFRDADEFHSEENKKKMASKIPLTDQDRLPWLQSIHQHINNLQTKSETGVVTCSALKKAYRDILRTGNSKDLHPSSYKSVVEGQQNLSVTRESDLDRSKVNYQDSSKDEAKDSIATSVSSGDTNKPSDYSKVSSSPKVLFVLLKGTRDLLASRLSSRKGHFMPADLLTSQLEILEEPTDDENSMTVDISASVPDIVAAIIRKL